jgi:hypothetical protein
MIVGVIFFRILERAAHPLLSFFNPMPIYFTIEKLTALEGSYSSRLAGEFIPGLPPLGWTTDPSGGYTL